MQHTDMYNLNQPEMDDTFSTQPLNDNARSTESTTYLGEIAAKAEIAARQALEGRVTALEAHHIAVGRYRGGTTPGDETWRAFSLDFTPEVVILQLVTSGNCAMVVRNCGLKALEIIENGFQVRNVFNGTDYNNQTFQYIFVALA